MPSCEGTESLMPYLACAMLTSGAISQPLSPTEIAAGQLLATSAAASSVRYAVSCSSRRTKKCRLKEKVGEISCNCPIVTEHQHLFS